MVGIHGVIAVVRDGVTAEPPFTAGSFPTTITFEDVASVDCTASITVGFAEAGGDSGPCKPRSFPLVL